MVNLSPTLAPSLLSVSLGQAAGEGRVSDLFARLPEPLRSDETTLRRLENLIRPVNEAGTRGSYAGWIVRSTLAACAERADAANFASLVSFFQRGGSIRELERIAARVLPKTPEPRELPWIERLGAEISPLSGWRSHRRRILSEPDDPLRFLKRAELDDRRLRLTAGDAGRTLSEAQLSAYLLDDDLRSLSERIADEAGEWVDEYTARQNLEDARAAMSPFLADEVVPFERLWPPQIRGALKCLGDDHSRAAALRIHKEYALKLETDTRFNRLVRERRQQEGHLSFTDPSTQNAVYFPKSEKGGPTLFVRSRPIDLPWNLSPFGVFFEVNALVIHEDDHHKRLKERGRSDRPEDLFSFEFSGHGREFLWRAQYGDPGYLRHLTLENPLGFGLAFRDYFEEFYAPAITSPRSAP